MSQVDITALHAALDTRRAALGLSWREVGRHTGLSSSVFSRMINGHRPDLDGYVACCRWLGMPMDTFTARAPDRDGDLNAELVMLLRRHGVPEAYWRPLGELIGHLTKPESG